MEAAPETQPIHLLLKDAGPGRNARFVLAYAAALGAGLLLRLAMLHEFLRVVGDSLVYGGIAKNLMLHGAYAFSLDSGMHTTLIRLPGYPLFLAACFKLFGMDNYAAAVYIQIGLDLVACLLLADFARRIAPPAQKRSAAIATLWLAALCPFTANYSVEPLTEGLTIFALALAMWAMAHFRDDPGWKSALWFTFAVTLAAILRPDGALVALAFAPALAVSLPEGLPEGAIARGRLARMAAVCVVLAALPFAVWTWRNWRVFHVFQPLAPRSACDPGEFAHPGWERWVKTWSLDYASTYQIYWPVPDEAFEVGKLPDRAFGSPAERVEVEAIAQAYAKSRDRISPALDARLDQLAEQRIRSRPWRYYVWLPLGRLADMVLRPRVETMNIDLDWWAYRRHPGETIFCWAYGGLNLIYFVLGAVGLWLRPRFWKALLAYVLLRCALLLTIASPEDRYTVEFFPILCAWGGVAMAAGMRWLASRHTPVTAAGALDGTD